MKRERHNLGTESCLSAGNESGNWEGTVGYSNKLTETSGKRKLFNQKNRKKIPLRSFYHHLYIVPSFNSSDIHKITEVNKSASYPRILGITQLKRRSPTKGDYY